MTKYCKICAFCVREGDYYHCIMQGRTKTERQICHTTNCKLFMESGDGVNIITGKKYQPNIKKQCSDFFTVNRRNTLARWIAHLLHGLARKIEGVTNG